MAMQEPTEVVRMSGVIAEPYEEDADWDGTVEALPADDQDTGDDVVLIPRKRGRSPLTLPAAAADYERAKRKCERLAALDVEGERHKVRARIQRDQDRLSALDSRDQDLKTAADELRQAETAFHVALAAVQGQ